MSNKTIKHIWPVSLMMSLAIIGVIAAFVVLAAVPRGASADGGAPHSCAGMTAAEIAIHNAVDTQLNGGRGQCLAPGATPMPGTTPATGDMIASDSTSGGGTAPELKVVIDSLPAGGLAVGSSIVLYLEDDYQEPAMIPASSVYFVASPASAPTGNGARVYTTIAPKIDTGAYFDEDKKDISIRVFIPRYVHQQHRRLPRSQRCRCQSNADDGDRGRFRHQESHRRG